MAKGSPLYNVDVQSDIDMKNIYKLVNYPASSTAILSVDKTIYVDAVNGTSAGSRGTTAAFQTLTQALAVAQAGDVIEVRSNLAYSGVVSIAVSGITLDFRNHVITCASQTDTWKISVGASGVTIQNLEINGTWDHSTGGVTTGAAISTGYPRTTLKNIYIHDLMDAGIVVNGDWSGSFYTNITTDWTKLSGVYANSQNAAITGGDFGPMRITNTGAGGKGLAVAKGGAEINPVYGVNVHDIYYDKISGEGSSQEGIYLHGLTDYQVSHVRGSNSVWNVSNDSCQNGTISDVITRGGMRTQYCGMELASCYNMTVSNCILNGYSRTSGDVTITIASPGVMTWASHGMTNGQGIVFATTGALPTGINAGALYYVINTATNTFQVSTTEGGSAVNTTGSQSGTHTATLATSEHVNVATPTGLVASNAGPIGRFSINNVRSFGYDNGFWMQASGSYVDINGGYFSGWQTGVSIDGTDHVHLVGVTAESLGATGNTNTPISFRAESTALNDFRIIGCFLNASSTAESDISLFSAVAGGSLNGVSITGNTKMDSYSHSSGTVKFLTGSGGSINNVYVANNYPGSQWPNQQGSQGLSFTPSSTGWYRVISSGSYGLLSGKMDIATSKEDWSIAFTVPSYADPVSVTQLLGGVVHANTAVVTQVRVGNSSSVSTVDLNVGTSGITINLTLPDGFTFSGFLVDPPSFNPTAPTQTSQTITLDSTKSLVTGATLSASSLLSGGNPVETTNNKGAASGYAPLDGSSKVPVANLPTLSAGTIASTSSPLKGDGAGNAVAATTTGTGDNVLATSPTLITPTLGVATATSIDKWIFTAPSTAATITAGADNLTYSMPEISTKIGLRHIPQNSQSANYTTVLTDSGKNIYHPVGDANARTFTIDSNANVAYPIGTGLMFTNMSASNLTVAITADTMTLLGAGTTGSRTVGQYGRLYVEKDTSTSWLAVPIANVT